MARAPGEMHEADMARTARERGLERFRRGEAANFDIQALHLLDCVSRRDTQVEVEFADCCKWFEGFL